jgi:aspartate racemase
MESRKLGIIGGMGPDASVKMYSEIVRLTDARTDQQHLEIFIHNNNKIPDRTAAILGQGNSPVEELYRSAKFLETAGADVLIVPCITSHYFFPSFQKKISVPIINAIKETVVETSEAKKRISKVGVIATTGTVNSQLFHKAFSKKNIVVLTPDSDIQENKVMKAIYGSDGIKAGNLEGPSKKRIEYAAEILISQGAEAIIAGCTEIPLVLFQETINVPLIDPINVLAKRAIQFCRAQIRDGN